MKNFTNNFKQFTSRLSARWLIMALMLFLGTGSIWGAEKALYLNAGGSSLWDQGSAKFVAYVWADGVSATWHEATKVGSYYQVMVSDKVTKVIWLRKNPSGYVYNNWTCWNRVGDVTGMNTNNLTTVNGWSESSFTTSYYDDISTYTVSGTDNAVKLSDSDIWVTYTLYKDGTAVSNSAQTGTGSALSWTVTDGGEYTVKGTNTYKTEDMSGSYTYSSCTPENPTFVHTNSSYSEITTPTYYLGDKAYFKSTIDCCLTGNWTKDGDGTYKTLTGSTPNFNLILSGVGSFTLTNNATDGCSGTTTPSISFTTNALPVPTSQSGTGSTTSATLSWSPNNTYKTVMVVRYAKDAAVTAPTQGTAYTAGSSKIGNGTVVYKGTGTSYTNTGLTTGNSYDYYFYTVNNNYYSTSVKVTVSTCINIETLNITAAPICAGSTATLTLNNKQNGVTYTLDDAPIFTDGDEYTTPILNTRTTYTITATSTNSCEADQKVSANVTVEVNELPDAPVLGKTEEIVCPNTQFTLPTIDGEGKWYAQEKGGNAYASTTINGITETTYYYAEAVKYGCASATRTQYTVNVHTTPVAPVISLNPATVGQDKNSVLSISNETYSPSNTKYELYKGSEKVGEMTAQTTNVSSSNVGDVIYSVKATHKECTALTSTSNEVTLKVQEKGAIIAELGDLKVDPQDPVDFVAMYVKNDGLSDYTDQGATKVTGYTWQFYNDDDKTWMDCASTNAVAGATYSIIGMENGSKNCNNFRPSAPGKYRCKVTYDKGEQTSNVLTVTGDGSTAKTFKGVTMNIPVISVNTGKEKFPTCDGLSGTASKNADVIKEKISVDVKIFAKVGENIEVVYDRKARMNYRGSSSLNFVKKSYAFCTAKEKTKNDKGAVDTGKENLFGLSNGVKDKDWVLYAAAADPSIMRNRLMFDTFRDMTGGWSVNSMYVELVINGEYKGVYVLMDKITANMGDEEKNIGGRVKVEWKLDKQGNTTQEGFIVKFDKTDIVDRYENTSGDQKTFKSTYSGHDGFTTYDTQIDQRFEVEYPEKEDIEEEDLEKGQQAGDWSVVFNSIKDKFNKFEKELKEGNFTEVQKLIDYQSWADWFIITEFAKNIDGYRASNLFVYDGSKPNAKIEARPLWDQELSFDNQCPNYYASYGANSEEGLIVENSAGFDNDASTPFWFTGKYKGGRGTYNGSNQTFKGLLDDPCFVAMVKTRWDTHKANALSESKLNDKLDAYTTEMGAAKEREAAFWSTRSRETCQCSHSGTTGYVNKDFDTSKGTISSWINKRPAGLSAAIEALKGLDLTISLTVTPDGGITTPWEAVMVQVNNPSGYDYDFEYTTNSLDQVEGVIIQESNDKYTYRIPRPSAWGTGDGARAAIEYGIEASLKVGEDSSQCGSDLGEKLTKATATITLTDEENDDCTELTD